MKKGEYSYEHKCCVCGKTYGRFVKTDVGILCYNHYYYRKRNNGLIKHTIYDSQEIVVEGDIAKIKIYNSHGDYTGEDILIDACNIDKIKNLKWHFNRERKSVGAIKNGKTVLLHRMLIDAKPKKLVDHINGNVLDNRMSNLRLCTAIENGHNHKVSSANTSGITGVSWMPRYKKWQSYITVDKKRIHLGNFSDFSDAVYARFIAECKYFGKFAREASEKVLEIVSDKVAMTPECPAYAFNKLQQFYI